MKKYYYLEQAIKSKNINQIESAFEKFYDENYKIVCGTIYKYVKNISDVEEIANDVFLLFFNSVQTLNFNKDISSYINHIAKYQALNYLKSAEYKSRQSYILSNDLVNKAADYHKLSNQNDILKELENILKPKQYEILINKLLYNHSFKEISIYMGMSINTVKSTYRRTLNKVKERMDIHDF